MFVLVLGRSRSRFAGSDLERDRAHSFRWLWRWRYTCSHSEHSSQAHQRRWYLGVPPWESRSPPGFLERPPLRWGPFAVQSRNRSSEFRRPMSRVVALFRQRRGDVVAEAGERTTRRRSHSRRGGG